VTCTDPEAQPQPQPDDLNPWTVDDDDEPFDPCAPAPPLPEAAVVRWVMAALVLAFFGLIGDHVATATGGLPVALAAPFALFAPAALLGTWKLAKL
jgi:hypothetical protein